MFKAARVGIFFMLVLAAAQLICPGAGWTATGDYSPRQSWSRRQPLMPEQAVRPQSAQSVVDQQNAVLELLKRN